MSTGGPAPSLASWVTRAGRLYQTLTHGTWCTLQVHHQRWSPENLEALPWPAVARVSKCPMSTKNWIKAEPSGLTSRYGLNTFFFFLNFFFNVYLFLGQRETEHERGRCRERRRHRIGNRLQALSHQPRARRGARTHGPRDRDLAEGGRLTDCATQAPQGLNTFKRFYRWLVGELGCCPSG